MTHSEVRFVQKSFSISRGRCAQGPPKPHIRLNDFSNDTSNHLIPGFAPSKVSLGSTRLCTYFRKHYFFLPKELKLFFLDRNWNRLNKKMKKMIGNSRSKECWNICFQREKCVGELWERPIKVGEKMTTFHNGVRLRTAVMWSGVEWTWSQCTFRQIKPMYTNPNFLELSPSSAVQ